MGEQLSMFEENNERKIVLKGDSYVCLNGEFSISNTKLKAKLKAIGCSKIKQITPKAKNANVPTRDTVLYIVGDEPNENSLKKYEVLRHDGFGIIKIGEEELMDFLNGNIDLNIPETVPKKVEIDYSHYEWTPPVINNTEFVIRVESPVKYNLDSLENPLYTKEIFIPQMAKNKKIYLKQLLGNFGGRATEKYSDKTSIVMLSQDTINKLKEGVKDDVIVDLENQHNNIGLEIFNIQFTSINDFTKWVKARLQQFPDSASQRLLDEFLA